MSWTYTDTADQVIAVTECTNELAGAHIGINARDGRSVIVCVPADKRRNAAQAVAGDDYRVVPACEPDPEDIATAKEQAWDEGHSEGITCEPGGGEHNPYRDLPKQPDRPEPVDPASVRVGDQVEIEADDGSWMVRARIADTDDAEHDGPRYPIDSPFGIKLDRFYLWPRLTGTTVRILHPAEPEPDEAAVEALAPIVQKVCAVEPHHAGQFARDLVRNGVQMEVRDA